MPLRYVAKGSAGIHGRKTRRRGAAALVATAILVMVAAACSSSSATSGSPSPAAPQGAPLVIVDNTGHAFARTFNPYIATSLDIEQGMLTLLYEPLLMFNIMKPTTPAIPWLATGYKWSDGGKTLTFSIRQGVKFSDGEPLTAQDVAFTFNLLKKFPALFSAMPGPTPLPTSATAVNPATAVLTFSQPQYANLFLIASTYILPQHVWRNVGSPATYADPDPVGSGPYVLASFSPQQIVLKANPLYWQKSLVRVPEVIYPNYDSNTSANQALESGKVDYAAEDVPDVQSAFLGTNTDNHTWMTQGPWFPDNSVVTLWLNVTKAPLNDPKVRLAISAGIDRQQLSARGETGYEPPATSSSGLLLPIDNSLLDPTYKNDLPAVGDPAKVAQILTSDGYVKSGGKWLKNGRPIKFTIEDPPTYTDYASDAQLISGELNADGFEVSFGPVPATQWSDNFPIGNFQAMIHWGIQGPNPYYYFDNWLDDKLSAPIGSPAGGDFGRFNSPQAQAALAKFAGSDDPTVQQQALDTLQQIVSTQAPVIPLLYGAAWYEYSTKHYVGWPTQTNQYSAPTPAPPFIEYTILHLTPAS